MRASSRYTLYLIVNSPLCRSLLLSLCLAPSLLAADAQPAAAATPAPAEAKPAAGETLQLPTMQVTAQRIKKLDKEIKRLDKMIARESKNIKSTELDKTLNNAPLVKAATIFGGNTAEHLSAVAASRVALMEQERDVLDSMKRPLSLDDLALLQAQLDQLRETRRNLDDAEKQR